MRYKAVAFAVFLLLASLPYTYSWTGSTSNTLTLEPQQRRGRTTRRRPIGRPSQKPRVDYTKFSHRTQPHQHECSACHKFPSSNWKEVRKGPDAFADVTEYPQHSSCLSCHSKQFFARERPAPRICSVCHVGVTPHYTERYPFPNPPEIFNASSRTRDFVSDFRIQFTHDTHVELVGRYKTAPSKYDGPKFQRASFARGMQPQDADKSCGFCHQTYQPQGKSSDEFVSVRPTGLAADAFWLKKGTFKTSPNHAICFTCHTAEGDMKPAATECAVCHKLQPAGRAAHVDFEPQLASSMGITDGNILARWRRRHSAGTFGHDAEMHREQGCSTCHKVSTINTLDESTTRVPIVACDTCHIGASADEGALNFEIEKRKVEKSFQCTKCHITFGKEPIPEGHMNALPKTK